MRKSRLHIPLNPLLIRRCQGRIKSLTAGLRRQNHLRPRCGLLLCNCQGRLNIPQSKFTISASFRSSAVPDSIILISPEASFHSHAKATTNPQAPHIAMTYRISMFLYILPMNTALPPILSTTIRAMRRQGSRVVSATHRSHRAKVTGNGFVEAQAC
jgi:hypothetical protein